MKTNSRVHFTFYVVNASSRERGIEQWKRLVPTSTSSRNISTPWLKESLCGLILAEAELHHA